MLLYVGKGLITYRYESHYTSIWHLASVLFHITINQGKELHNFAIETKRTGGISKSGRKE